MDRSVSRHASLAALAAHLVPAHQIEAREQRGRLSTGIAPLDELLGGGWPRGALSELSGARGCGRTAVLIAALAEALRRGEAAALVDGTGAFDPLTAVRAGVPLERLLWVRGGPESPALRLLAAAAAIVAAGGFGLVALDLGEEPPAIPTAAWIRLRRLAGAPGTAVLVVAARRMDGVLGACALTLRDARPHFTPAGSGATPLLAGLDTQVLLARHAGTHAGRAAAGPALRLRHPLADADDSPR